MAESLLAGVDIGGTKTAVVLSGQPPYILARRVFETRQSDGPDATIRNIVQSLREMVAAEGPSVLLRGIGVSCGGPLNPASGRIQQPPNLPSWDDVPITDILAREFGVKCYLENDADAGALAEWSYGSGVGTRNFIFLTMGTGIGAGLLLNGALYRGSTNSAGEIGHVRLTATGPIGHNKPGAVEGWASGGGVPQVARLEIADAALRGEWTVLAQCSLENLTARDVAEAAEQGDAVAQKVLRVTGERLGEALAVLVDLLNPDCIAVGGLALRLGNTLLDPARAVVLREALPANAAACRIVPAALGEAIGDVAALCAALEGEKHERGK